jgi:hypothetical protein
MKQLEAHRSVKALRELANRLEQVEMHSTYTDPRDSFVEGLDRILASYVPPDDEPGLRADHAYAIFYAVVTASKQEWTSGYGGQRKLAGCPELFGQ